MIRFVCIAAAMLAGLAMTIEQANAQAPLFSQYTTQGNGSPSAAIYPAPHWSPIVGGESYYTYQPLMPHEMMYQHSRNYYNYYDAGYKGGGGGLVKTSVHWQAGNNHFGPLPLSTGLSGAAYRLQSRRYNIGGGSGGIGGGLGSGLGSGLGGGLGSGIGSKIGHGRLRGGFGSCLGGCRSAEEATSSDAFLGDQFQGEAISGCAGGCTADAGSTLQR